MGVIQTPQAVVHDLAQARAALAAAAAGGRRIQLRSAPDAAAYAGIGYLQALGAAVGHELLIDCGDDAGLVMAALRSGCRKLVFTGSSATAAKLADMAADAGAELWHEAAPTGT
jgi:acyl-CoA reductase-like NAD-dependent aldehyde dehydrogenase